MYPSNIIWKLLLKLFFLLIEVAVQIETTLCKGLRFPYGFPYGCLNLATSTFEKTEGRRRRLRSFSDFLSFFFAYIFVLTIWHVTYRAENSSGENRFSLHPGKQLRQQHRSTDLLPHSRRTDFISKLPPARYVCRDTNARGRKQKIVECGNKAQLIGGQLCTQKAILMRGRKTRARCKQATTRSRPQAWCPTSHQSHPLGRLGEPRGQRVASQTTHLGEDAVGTR